MKNVKNPLIFIVQDSVVYKDMILGFLKSKNYTNIKTFKTGEECLKSIHLKPDIIVLDYSFGGITGLDLMKKVQDEHPEIKFIFLSGQNDVEVAVTIMKIGAADYIVKNDKALQNLLNSIEQLKSTKKRENVKKGFQMGVIGFFIITFLLIMIIILLTIFLEDFSL
jgi:FixJ family two-component response regulator